MKCDFFYVSISEHLSRNISLQSSHASIPEEASPKNLLEPLGYQRLGSISGKQTECRPVVPGSASRHLTACCLSFCHVQHPPSDTPAGSAELNVCLH